MDRKLQTELAIPSNNERIFSFRETPYNVRNFQCLYCDNKKLLSMEPKLLHTGHRRYGILFQKT